MFWSNSTFGCVSSQYSDWPKVIHVSRFWGRCIPRKHSGVREFIRKNSELWMVIQIRRHFVFRERMLLKRIQHDLDSLLELRIVAFANELGIELDFDIGRDATVLHFPFALGSVNGPSWRRDAAAVHELRIISDPHKPTPSLHADQWPDARLAEVPGHSVAARAGKFIDDHCLGTVDRLLRLGICFALSGLDEARDRAA